MREKELIVYRDFEDGELLYDMAFLMSHYDDEYYNTEDMAALFYEMGHRKIAYVGTLLATESITDRYFGYQKALLELGPGGH